MSESAGGPEPVEIRMECWFNHCRWSKRVDRNPSLRRNPAARNWIRLEHMRTHTRAEAEALLGWLDYIRTTHANAPTEATYVDASRRRLELLDMLRRGDYFPQPAPGACSRPCGCVHPSWA